MKRFLLALPLLAAVAWLLLRVGSAADPVVRAPGSPDPSPPEAPPGQPLEPLGQPPPAPESAPEPAAEPAAREAISTATDEATPAPSSEASLLRFIVHAPEGQLADDTVSLVMEKEGDASFGDTGLDKTSSENFAANYDGMTKWVVLGEASGSFGDVLELVLPEASRTRVRLAARCANLAPFESTNLRTGGAPHELRPTPAGEVRFRLIDGSGGGVDMPSLVGSGFPLHVSPASGLVVRGPYGLGTGPRFVFDEDLSASAWGIADGALVRPQWHTMGASNGSKVRVMWSGATLGSSPHREVRVEVVPLASIEVSLVDDATGDPIPKGELLLEGGSDGRLVRSREQHGGGILLDCSPLFEGTLTALVDGYVPVEIPFAAKEVAGPLTLRLAKSRRLRGRVIDLEGRPIPGVTLRCYTSRRWEEKASTDALGAFSFSRPADQGFDIVLHSAGLDFRRRVPEELRGRKALLVPKQYDRDVQDLVLTVASAVTLSGKASHRSGEPIVKGGVIAAFAPASQRSNRRLMYNRGESAGGPVTDGAYKVKDLPPGRWQLTLRHELGSCTYPPMEILEDTVLDLDFVPTGSELIGRVVKAGGPQHGFRVTLMGPSGPLYLKTDPTGSFRFGGLEPGHYSLIAASETAGSSWSPMESLAVGAWYLPESGTTHAGEIAAHEVVNVVCAARLSGGDLPNRYRVEAIDTASGVKLKVTSFSGFHSTQFSVPVGRRVLLRLVDRRKNVVRESVHTFESGSRPIVDLSPR